MADAQCQFHPALPGMGRTAHRHILGAAGDRRHRRDLCCPFAGACAASSTVTTPTTTPAHRPAGLSCQTGVAANSPPMPYRSAAQIVQLAKVPSTRPMGTAVLHQLRASSRTNRMTCRLLMPMQRIMPKNWVRWARLLFMLPEIISTPASSTSTNSTAAIPYTV